MYIVALKSQNSHLWSKQQRRHQSHHIDTEENRYRIQHLIHGRMFTEAQHSNILCKVRLDKVSAVELHSDKVAARGHEQRHKAQ